MPQKVILDVDTGADDAIALLMAGHHPELDLVAVVTTFGNASINITLENTLRLMDSGQLSAVHVFKGADRPLVADLPDTPFIQKRKLPIPESKLTSQPDRAVDFLIDYYLGLEGTDTIYVPLGPQTNLALALRLEPQLAARIPQIVTMAGAYIEGNTTPSAEFNIFADPEAAHIVFNSGIPITMIGLEATSKALITSENINYLEQLNTPLSTLAANIMQDEIQWFIEHHGSSGGQIYDACAVAAIIDPYCIQIEPMRVDVELRGEHTRGRTVADISSRHFPTPNVDVAVNIDRARFLEILFEIL